MSTLGAIMVREVTGTDPVMRDVATLCYETLHRPFGVCRDDTWNETDPGSSHFVAMDGDRLAGYTRLLVENGLGHVRQVAVDRGYRCHGVASTLVERAVARASELGLPVAYLNARANAVRLYERLGFTIVSGPFRMGRTYLPHVRMQRPLS